MNILQKRIAWAAVSVLILMTFVVPWRRTVQGNSIPTGYGFIFEPRYVDGTKIASVDVVRWLVPMMVTVIAGLTAIRLTAER